jgi:hypothetical protein
MYVNDQLHAPVTLFEEEESPVFLGQEAVFYYLLFYFQLRTAAFKAYYAILVRRSNFRHQASPRLSSRESIQRREKCQEMFLKCRLPRYI